MKRGLNEACNERACIALYGCACKQLIGDFEQYQFKYKSKHSFRLFADNSSKAVKLAKSWQKL